MTDGGSTENPFAAAPAVSSVNDTGRCPVLVKLNLRFFVVPATTFPKSQTYVARTKSGAKAERTVNDPLSATSIARADCRATGDGMDVMPRSNFGTFVGAGGASPSSAPMRFSISFAAATAMASACSFILPRM